MIKKLKKMEDLNQMPLFEPADLIKQHLLDLKEIVELAKKKKVNKND